MMKRLIAKNKNGQWELIGVDFKDVSPQVYGALCKLKDYEGTGYTPDFIDTIPHILQDIKDRLNNPSATNVKSCIKMIGYILNAKEKDR